MSVIDTLIFDRTQADVDRVYALKQKILTGGLTSLTAEEKAEYMGGMRGAYNATDLNRVGQAVSYLADRFTDLPGELEAYREEKGVADDELYHVPYDPSTVVVSPKQNWTVADIPTNSQVQTYLNNLTFDTANQIEYLLWLVNAALVEVENDLYGKIDRAAESFWYAGEVNCGE